MAELHNGRSGAAYLAFGLEILRMEPRQGMISRGPLSMNSDLDLLWGQVSYQVGDALIFQQEVLLYSTDLLGFCADAEAMLEQENKSLPPETTNRQSQVLLDISSPELEMKLYQRIHHASGVMPRVEKIINQVNYTFHALVETGIAAHNGVNGEGPGMLLKPDGSTLLEFIRDLHSETKIALLLD